MIFGKELALSSSAWHEIWKEIDIAIEGDREAQRLVRLHLFHMMVSASHTPCGTGCRDRSQGLAW